MPKPIEYPVKPPAGFEFFARRLNRHRHHLAQMGNVTTLCGAEDETIYGEHGPRMVPTLNATEVRKLCIPCLEKAGATRLAVEVKQAIQDHEDWLTLKDQVMRDAIGEIRDQTHMASSLSRADLQATLAHIKAIADRAINDLPI